MATESKKIEVAITTEADEKALLKYEKAFKDLIDKLRKANPTFAVVQKRLKTLTDAMLVAGDATAKQRAAWTQEIKLLKLVGKEYQVSAKMREQATKNAILSEEELDEAARKSMATYRAQFKTIASVSAEIKKLSLRITEARKSQQLSDLQFSGRISLWNQEKHQLNEVRRELVANEKAQDDLAKAAEKASKDQQKAAKEAAAAQEKQGKGIARLIKQMILWGAGSASLYYIWRKVRTAVLDTTKAIFGNTEEAERLSVAWEKLKKSMALSLIEYESMIKVLDRLAIYLDKQANKMLESRATIDAGKVAIAGITDQYGKAGAALYSFTILHKDWIRAASNAARFADNLTGGTLGLADAWDEAYQASLDFNTGIATASDETKDYSSQISSLVSRMREFNDAAAAQAQAIREIEQAFKDASAVARGQYAASLMQIDIDLQKEITKINAKALEDRADAYENYQDKLRDLQAAGNIKRKSDAERHALEMEFAQRRHSLSLLQNERMYQYSRGLLVAEGDVLAIEDLDARYELEKQAAEENFALQMQQAEAMFRLQAKIQEESMRRQIAVIQQGLREQLAEIEEGRREEIAEAEAAAQEKEAAAADEQATMLAAAIQAYQEDMKAQKEGQAEREQSLIDFFVDMGVDTDIGLEGVLGIAKQYFDVGGSFDSTMKTAWERQATYTQIFTDAITQAVQASVVQLQILEEALWSIGGHGGGFGGGGPRGARDRTPPPGTISSFAHGTDTIISTPTNIEVGHGPERVVVQPLSSIGVGGNVSMSWKGGPIPIHGGGSMSGIDTTAIGDAIAQGLVNEMAWSFASLRGSRGG